MDPSRIDAEIIALTAARGPEKSICPSEVARALHPDWRPFMTPVRERAAWLARAGQIDILRKGKVIAPDDIVGVIRLRTRTGS